MEKEKLGQGPAFPVIFEYPSGKIHASEGMTKRFFAATITMQGLIPLIIEHEYSYIEVVMMAYKLADELLKQENE